MNQAGKTILRLRAENKVLRSLIGDYREGIDRDGAVAWSKEEAAAWYKAAGGGAR